MVSFVGNKELRLLVINCVAMRFTAVESLSYLKEKGYTINERTYHRIKKKIIQSRFKRMNEISSFGFIDSHLQGLDTLLHCQKEMWTNYYQEKNPYKKVEILTQIANLQPYISEYTCQTKEVMQHKATSIKETESISQ